jgi:hypothetical protein
MILLVLALGCPRPSDPISPSDAPPEELGGDGLGFVEANTANGRYAVVRRWEEGVTPSFGHHGEADPEPQLVLLDFVEGTARPLQDIVDVDATRRFLLVQQRDTLVVLDGENGATVELPGVDPTNDWNRCLPHRSAAFSDAGSRVGWIGADASQLHVRDLGSGETWDVAAQGRLWRGWPDGEGRGAWLLEIPPGSASAEGWPVQNTSCACRWCNRFAMSYGVYGWGGPEFRVVHVTETTRGEEVPPESERLWAGPRADGCQLTASGEGPNGLEKGPWRWVCR